MDLIERLGQVDMMVDAAGWVPIYEYGPDHGLLLSQVKIQARMLRELASGTRSTSAPRSSASSTSGAAASTSRSATANGKVIPMPAALRKTLDKPQNKRYLCRTPRTRSWSAPRSPTATCSCWSTTTARRSSACRSTRSPPTCGTRRTWRRSGPSAASGRPSRTAPAPATRAWSGNVRWYYSDAYDGSRKSGVVTPDGVQSADRTHTMVHVAFNQQVGWAYGVPDALAAIAWARLYREFMVNGFTMTKALAKLAYKLTVPNKDAGVRRAPRSPGPARRAARRRWPPAPT
jgi:hypothetical protein